MQTHAPTNVHMHKCTHTHTHTHTRKLAAKVSELQSKLLQDGDDLKLEVERLKSKLEREMASKAKLGETTQSLKRVMLGSHTHTHAAVCTL